MESYDSQPTASARYWCADGHAFTDEREHYREVEHAWNDIPAHLREWPDFRPEPQADAGIVMAGGMAGLAVKPAPDLTALRTLLARVRAEGWEHIRYGSGDNIEHCWVQGRREVVLEYRSLRFATERCLGDGRTITIKNSYADPGAWNMTEIVTVAEMLGFLTPTSAVESALQSSGPTPRPGW